jgi:hypothetical protein
VIAQKFLHDHSDRAVIVRDRYFLFVIVTCVLQLDVHLAADSESMIRDMLPVEYIGHAACL